MPDAPTGLCSDTRPLAPTFANMQLIFSGICVTCHTTGFVLDLGEGVSYNDIVNKPALNYTNNGTTTMDSCGGTLVVPGHPETSYLYLKVSSAMPCAGSQMPLTDIGTTSPLMTCEQTAIHDWIAAGAPND